MKRPLSGLALAVVVCLAAAAPVSADTYTVYQLAKDIATEQPTNNECVAASAVTWHNAIDTSVGNSHAVVDAFYQSVYNAGLNKYTSSTNPPDPLYGIDPRGWAQLMFLNSPRNYTFNDYRYSTSSEANSEIVTGIATTFAPVGVLVAHGDHAILAVGYNTTGDPVRDQSWSLNGLRIIDPWWSDGSVYPNKPLKLGKVLYDLAPYTYITTASWNADYFLKYVNNFPLVPGGTKTTIWGPDSNGKQWYALVLRKDSTTQAPVDPWNASPPYADSRVASVGSMLDAADPAYPSLSDAVAGGITANDLGDRTQLGVSLTGVTLTNQVLVQSLDPTVANYYLVGLAKGNRTVALAMIPIDQAGYHFGAVTLTNPGSGLPSAADAAAALGASAASVQAVWRASGDAPTPFDPIWQGRDAAGSVRTISMDGSVGVTP
jgi:hypothetical protein